MLCVFSEITNATYWHFVCIIYIHDSHRMKSTKQYCTWAMHELVLMFAYFYSNMTSNALSIYREFQYDHCHSLSYPFHLYDFLEWFMYFNFRFLFLLQSNIFKTNKIRVNLVVQPHTCIQTWTHISIKSIEVPCFIEISDTKKCMKLILATISIWNQITS